MVRKITEHLVRGLKPRDRRYTLADDGLQVEVHPSGSVVFYFKFREAGRQTREKLGPYHPDTYTLRMARERVRELQAKLANDDQVHQSGMTLAEYLESNFKSYIEDARVDATGTMRRLRAHFIARNPSIGNTRLKNLTTEQIERWKVSAARKLKPATVNRILGDLRRALAVAVDFGYLRKSPADGIKQLHVDVESTKLYMSPDEFTKFTKAVERWEYLHYFGTKREQHDHSLWFALFVRIAINTGARKGEVLSLKWDDVDQINRVITFHGVNTKNRRTRRLPVNDDLLKRLKEYNSERDLDTEQGDDDVFPVRDIKKPFQRFATMAGLSHLTPHLLRHHVASTLVLRGAALSVVRDLLGHSSLEVTSRYLSVRTQDKLDALNLL